MSTTTTSSFNEMMQRYADEYLQETGKDAATAREFAVWAIQTGRWEPRPDMLIKKCQEDFSRALREEYIRGPDGQPVRAKHVARLGKGDEQQYLWADIRTAPRRHMQIAFQQRRGQIVGDCRQLKRDVDFFNGIHEDDGKPPIQLVFDFTDDIAEGECSTEFTTSRPPQPR